MRINSQWLIPSAMWGGDSVYEGAKEGDTFEISKEDGAARYLINVVKAAQESDEPADDGPVRIKISNGRRSIH